MPGSVAIGALIYVAAASLALLGSASAQGSWSPVDASTAAFPSSGGALIANATHVVVVGGAGGDGSPVPPSAFNYATTAWTTMPAFPGAAAAAVAGGAVAQVDPQTAYVFGGQLSSGAYTSAVVRVTPSGATAVVTTGAAPPPRAQAAAVYLSACFGSSRALPGLPAPCLVVSGGASGAVPFFNDLYVLNLGVSPPAWSAPATGGAPPPAGRYGASAVASGDGSYALFFGGVTAAGPTNDLYAFAPGGFATPRVGEYVNVARPGGVQAPTAQKSEDAVWAGHADRANDGNYNSNYNGLRCTASNNACSSSQSTYNLCTTTNTVTPDTDPWWRVDLGATRQLDNVRVWGRTDCCMDRLDGFRVYVSDVDNVATATAGGACYNGFTTAGDPPATVDMTSPLDAGGRCAAARYVWIVLPGPAKILTLCEVEVNARLPWVWRQLSGVAEVAQGKPAYQSSDEIGFSSGDANRAVDGYDSGGDYFRGSCSHTLENYNQPADAPWLMVDLGAAYDVTAVQLWPRTDCCTPQRNTRWAVAVGMSTSAAYDYSVPGVPDPVGNTVGQVFSARIDLPAPTRGRFVIVSRSFVMGDINVLSICEMKVFAQLLSDQPAPRSSAAAAGYGGTMLVFGGVDGAGTRLADLRVFDPVNGRWLPAARPLGTAPSPRAGATLLVMGTTLGAASATRVVLFGGAGGAGALGDVFYYGAAGCTAPSTVGTTFTLGHSGTFQVVACLPTYTSTNGGAQLVCDPTTGAWQGLYNLATNQVCLPPPPSGAAISSVSPVSPTSVNVFFSLGGGDATYAVLAAAAVPTYFETFASLGGPADLGTKWTWTDATAQGRYTFPAGTLRIDATLGADCTATLATCPMLSRAFPTEFGVSAADFTFEAWVAFDPNDVQLGQFAGVGVMRAGAPPALALFAGLRMTGTSPSNSAWQIGFGTPSGSCASWFTFDYPIAGTFVRLERVAAPAGAGASSFRASFRTTLTQGWVPLSGSCPEAALPGGALPPAATRIGGVAKNPNAARPGAAIITDIRVASRTCQAPGTVRATAASPALITGLTPGGTYSFTIAAATAAQVGPESAPAFPTTLAPASPPGPPSLTAASIAAGRPAIQTGFSSTTGTQTAYFASAGVDGVTDQVNNFFAMGTAPCGDLGCWWQVDVGAAADIALVSIWNRADSDANAQLSAGIAVFVSSGGGASFVSTGSRCADVPPSLLNATPDALGRAYYADVPCAATGRYVTVLAPAGQPLALSEVAVFAFNSCPAYIAAGAVAAVGSSCSAGAPFGAQCASACAAGYSLVSGATATTCRGAGWDAPPLVCAPTCPALAPPTHATACRTTLVADGFDALTEGGVTTAANFFSLSPDPATALGAAWFVVDGVLQASVAWGCGGELFLAAGAVAVRDYRGDFTMTTVLSTDDRAGVVRALDLDNFVRFTLDVVRGVHTLDAVIGGSRLVLSSAAAAFAPMTPYRITFAVTGATIAVAVDGAPLLTSTYAGINAGYMGVYAGTYATFDAFAVDVPCAACVGATPSTQCTFTCAPGYVAVGNATAVCAALATVQPSPSGSPAASPSATAFPTVTPTATASIAPGLGVAAWVGGGLTCVLPPPVFSAATRAVPENSPRGTLVGAPLVVSASDPTASLQFQVIGGGTASNAAGPIFGVDACSGQLWVAQAVLDYEATRAYTVNVSVVIVGSGAPPVFAAVTVNVLNVQEPPVIVAGQSFNLSAAAAVGDVIGRVAYWDPENDTAVFNIVVDGSDGIVGFANASTGALGVASTAGLDFYVGRRSFVLQVACHDPNNAGLAAAGAVAIAVREAPTAPTVAPNQVVPIPWGSASVVGAASSVPVVATLPANVYNGSFRSAVTYALVPYPQAASACGIAVTNGTGVNATEYPTTTGLVGAAPLFSVVAGTGVVTVATLPTGAFPPWASRTPTAVAGYLALASYRVCFNATTTFNRWATQAVTVAVTTAVAAGGAVITGYRLATGPWAGAAGLVVDTLAPSTVFFVGSGFGAAASNTSGAVRANYSSAVYSYAATNCAVFNSTLITCNTVGGVGAGLLWTVYLSGAVVPSTVALTTSYQPPTVTALANNTGMPTAGGVEIVLSGRYFGAAGGGVLSYGPPTNPAQYSCTLRTPSWRAAGPGTDAFASCVAARGAGAALQWSLNVGGQVVFGVSTPAAAQTLSYRAPVVLSVSAGNGTNASAAALDTRGGTAFTISGTDFGGSPSNVVTVAYGAVGTGVTYAAACARSPATSTTSLACVTAPGVGFDLAVSVTVDGQASPARAGLGLAYAPPAIASVAGGYTSMDTPGGTGFTLVGSNFGVLPPDWVRYGPVGPGGVTKYAALNCAVVSPHVVIACTSAAGAGGGGGGYAVQAAVGGQASNVLAAGMSYAPPVITAFAPVTLPDTRGGTAVLITGVNFGPGGDPSIAVVARYSARGSSGRADAFAPTNCSVTTPHTQITCTIAPGGAGANLQWTLTVGGLSSVTPTTSYAPPVVHAIVDAATGAPVPASLDPNGVYTWTLQGANFGAPPTYYLSQIVSDLVSSVTYGPTGIEYRAPFVHVDDVAITVTVGPASCAMCYFRVVVEGQSTTASTPAFAFATPQIVSIAPAHGPTANPPGNATAVTLAVSSPPLLDPLIDLVVRLVSGTTSVTIAPVVPETLADVTAATNTDGSVNIVFSLPPAWAGQGLGVQLVPVGAPQGAQPSLLTAATTFSYDAPFVAEAFVLPAQFTPGGNASFRFLERRLELAPPCPWRPSDPTWACDGSRGPLFQVVLIGRNFGANPATQVTPDPATRQLMEQHPGGGPLAVAASWVSSSGAADAATVTIAFWSDSVISAYSYLPTASLTVRLLNKDWAGNDVVAASAPATYAPGAPVATAVTLGGVPAVLGTLFNASTAGGALLSVTIAGPQDTFILLVNDAVCPPAGAPVAAAGGSFTYSCTLPPGQGSTNLFEAVRSVAGVPTGPEALLAVIAYGPPHVAEFDTWQYYPTPGWVAYPMAQGFGARPVVTMPTNGSLLEVEGSNLGTSPVLVIQSGNREIAVSGSSAWVCPGRTADTCWIFAVPAGEGAGYEYSATGFSVYVVAGDQSSAFGAPRFAYNAPVVTSVSSSSATPRCAFPTLGACADGRPITITLTGHDFGAPIAAFGETVASEVPVVSFYRPVDVGGFATAFNCLSPQRASHWTITCTLPPGSGAALTVRVQVVEPQWFGDSTPGFSYDAPVIAEAWVAVRYLPLPAPQCMNSTTEYYDNDAQATLYRTTVVCPPAPQMPAPMDPRTYAPGGPLANGAAFNLPSGGPAWNVSMWSVAGGPAANGSLAAGYSFAGVAPSPFAPASGAPLAAPTMESGVDAAGAPQFYSYITLVGANFGAAAPGLHCPRVAWAFRAAYGNAAPRCDGTENFLGEGEIDSTAAGGRIVLWSDSKVVFVVPSGVGLRDVDLDVRGNGLALPPGSPARPRLQYMAPNVTSTTPRLIDAAGGTLVTLNGYNFGPDPWESAMPGMAIGNAASFNVPIALAPTLPTASLRVQFGANPLGGPQCVSSARRLDGSLSPYATPGTAGAWADCLTGAAYDVIEGQTTLTFYAPPGVGANRSVTIVLADGPAVNPMTPAAALAPLNITSNAFTLSYAPPVISGPLTRVALINGTSSGATGALTLLGFQFGPPSVDTDARWAPGDKQLLVSIGGVPCLAPARGAVGTAGQSSITCRPDSARAIVGTSNISLVIAGQVATVDPTSAVTRAVTVACGPNFFGRPGETCARCDPPGTPLMEDEAIAGMPGTPSVVCAGYAGDAHPEDLTCHMNWLQLSELSELPPLTPEQLSMFASLSVATLLTAPHDQIVSALGLSGDQLAANARAAGGVVFPSTPVCPAFPYPAPQPGYFNLNGTMAGQCPPGAAYPGRDVCIVPCLDDTCGADNVCATGYASLPPHFRCASCAPAGYAGAGSPAYYWRGGVCTQCPPGYQGIIIGYVVAIALAALVAYVTQRWGVHLCSASIGVDFFQVVAIFGSTRVRWPAQMNTLLHVLSAFYANVEIVAPECLDPHATFVTKFTGIVLLPAVFAALLLVVHAALVFSKVVVMGRHNEINRHSHTLVGAALVLMYFLYIYETRTLLAVFDCAPLTPSDGRSYMAAAPLEECDTDVDGAYAKLLAPSVVGLVVYTAGYPLAALATLWRHRELIMEDQLLRAKGVGDNRLTNPHAYELRKRFATLYASFTPDAVFWLGAILARKLLIALVPVLFNRNAAFQMAACVLVLMVAYGLQVRVAPYLSPANAEAVLRAHAEASFTSPIHARLRASIAGVEARGRKRMRRNVMDASGRLDRGALLNLLTAALLDPNTLEAALLFAAAVVALMGAMFESEALQAASYASAHTAVTAVAMTVIIVGIIYYVAVVLTELWAVVDARQREAALLARRRTSKSAGGAGAADGAKQRVVSPRGGASPRGGKRLGEVNTGQLDVALNPLFVVGAGGAGAGAASAAAAAAAASTSALDAVRAYSSTAPPLDMWRVFASSYEELHAQAAAMAAELAAAKAAAARDDDGGGAGGDPRGASGTGGGAAARRTEFGPRTASGTDVMPRLSTAAGSARSLRALDAYAAGGRR